MSETKVLLLDADGVLITPPKLFSEQYAEQRGIDPESLQPFFHSSDFVDATEGRADLKDALEKYRTLWQFEGDPSPLLEDWFAAENVIDQELLDIVRTIRSSGVPVYLATNQEHHRAQYLQDVMFPSDFDGFFISSDIGCRKEDEKFWVEVLRRLRARWADLEADEVVFFDDSADSIAGASLKGIRAILYETPAQVRAELLG